MYYQRMASNSSNTVGYVKVQFLCVSWNRHQLPFLTLSFGWTFLFHCIVVKVFFTSPIFEINVEMTRSYDYNRNSILWKWSTLLFQVISFVLLALRQFFIRYFHRVVLVTFGNFLVTFHFFFKSYEIHKVHVSDVIISQLDLWHLGWFIHTHFLTIKTAFWYSLTAVFCNFQTYLWENHYLFFSKGIVLPKMPKPFWLSVFCGHKKIFWRMIITKLFCWPLTSIVW